MNKIRLSGTILGEPVYSHTVFHEKFYRVSVCVKRKSDNSDTLNCVVPEVLMNGIVDGAKVTFIGEIRTRNVVENDDSRKLQIYVFVKEVCEYAGYDNQSVDIEGFICKIPKYRTTPLGREITDMLIASNRDESYKSDYIPCIAWGRNAIRANEMAVGTGIRINGRLQSRIYVKKLDDEKSEERTAYELSIARLEELPDENND